MSPLTRLAAAFLLALLLPVQGYAAACAQICALVEQQANAGMGAPMAHAEDEAPAHCDEGERGPERCCHAHTFLVDASVPTIAAAPGFQERSSFVARWKNFIPEEPSPPPIAIHRCA